MENPGIYLDRMRADAPLIHNIANYVSMNVMANVLLAAGASPAMIHAREEAAEFASIASALTVNIGTLSPDWVEAMVQAASAARTNGTLWVLDPVAAGATAYRRRVSADLLELKPDIVRGNASEIMALAGLAGQGKGVDSGDDVAAARNAAAQVSRMTGGITIVTGPRDLLTDGSRWAEVANGHSLMPQVTALGCSLTGIVAAFAAGAEDRFSASTAALAYYGLSGERAAEGANGPGSFAVRFLDALAGIDGQTLTARARIST